MNISDNNIIRMTEKEWSQIDPRAQRRVRETAEICGFRDGVWTFRFYGITDKQAMTELCAYFGLKVTE